MIWVNVGFIFLAHFVWSMCIWQYDYFSNFIVFATLRKTFKILCKLGIVSKFRYSNQADLRELINFYSPWNDQKTYYFLMVSGGIELSSSIRLILLNIRSEIWRLSLKTWLMSWFFLNLRVCYSCKLRTSTFTLLLIQPLYIFKAS